jgi:O-antigen/teichoic acid export membrane protein
MVIQIDKLDVFWTYLSRFLRIGQGLILLPLMLKLLPTDQIAIWALYATITALVSMFDLGFSNVFSRNATQILSGVKIGLNNSKGQITTKEHSKIEGIEAYNFKKLIIIMKKYYLYISLVILIFLLSFGSFYIHIISLDVTNKIQVYLSWVFLIGSTLLNFFYNYLAIILQSKGLIKETQRISVYGILLSMLFAIVGILLGWGLIAITFAGFISVLYNRFFLFNLYNREIKPILPPENIEFEIAYFKEIWKVTYKVSIGSISSLIIYRSGVIIISLFLPLKEAGSFAFSMNLAFIISEVSFMFFYSHLPQINSMVFLEDTLGLKKIFLSSIFMTILSFCVGGVVLIFFGNQILSFIGSNMLLIPRIPFTLIFVILLLDQIMNMSTFFLFSSNNLNYVQSYAISAILIVLFTWFVCKINPSYLAILLPQLIIQMCYNYWIWPYKIFKYLEIGFSDIKKLINLN